MTKAIDKALFSRRPKARYIRPWRTYALLFAAKLLPTAWLDAAMVMLGGFTQRTLAPKFARSLAALGVALALLGSASMAMADGGWEKISQKDGVTIERRSHVGSAYDELRASSTSPLTPAQLFATVWNYREFPSFVPYLKSLKVLDENGEQSHVYQQVHMPLVADRDYTLVLRKQVDTQTEVYQMIFDSTEAVGPAPHAPFVRAQNIHGSWTLEPADDGAGNGSRIFCIVSQEEKFRPGSSTWPRAMHRVSSSWR